MTIQLLILIVLFYVLGQAAELAIFNLRKIAEKLGIQIFFLGLILGFFTSSPELAIGVQSLVNNVPALTFGNLIGGIVVLFTIVLGVNLLLNKRIETGNYKIFVVLLAYLFLPLLFGLDGALHFIEGVLIIIFYFALVIVLYYLYRDQGQRKLSLAHRNGNAALKEIFLFIVGIAGVVILSDLIIDFSLKALSLVPISNFVIGLLIFAIGTNFPEIIVAIKAWRSGVKTLSMSNLIGSAMANVFIVGLLASIKTLTIRIDVSYYLLAGFILLLFIVLLIFYRTHRHLSRTEGLILLLLYVVFVGLQIASDTIFKI